jgi:hypothetical protein
MIPASRRFAGKAKLKATRNDSGNGQVFGHE